MDRRLRVMVATEDPLARAGIASLLEPERDIIIVDRPPADVVVWLATADGTPPAGTVLALAPDERGAARALAAGARGVLLRDAPGRKLAAALVAIARGLVVLDESLPLVPREPAATGEALTPRELEVVQRVALGLGNKEIARQLGISDSTVKFHLNSVLAKLGARSRTDAVVKAARLGLIVL
jgi:DNA-binding NarL/FixJ family response regulator